MIILTAEVSAIADESWLVRLEGLTPFREAWHLQRRLVAARQAGLVPDVLFLVEHEPVVTVGRSGERGHLLISRDLLRERGVEVYDIERGGSVTYHGPGQLVAYPILDLRALDEDVVRFMRALEESIIRTIGAFGVAGERLRGYPGVWVGGAKIAAVGVAVKRRVTMHGMALNVSNDLTPFSWINPCGLDRPVTSLAAERGRDLSVEGGRDLSVEGGRDLSVDRVAHEYARRFAEVYRMRLIPATRQEVFERLALPAAPPGAAAAPGAAPAP